jgi:hypothetical protein
MVLETIVLPGDPLTYVTVPADENRIVEPTVIETEYLIIEPA